MAFSSEKFTLNDEGRLFLKRLFRKIFLEDWLMKLVALIITLALWLGVSGLRETTTSRLQNPIALNLQILNNMEITNMPVQEVNIVVSGDKRKIESLNQRDLVISLDLTDVPPGEKLVQLTPENVAIGLPTGIKLVEIQPSKIVVNLEAVEQRDIPVKIESEGSTTEGFEVYSQTSVPSKINVRGPASYIKTLDFIATDKINLDNRAEDFSIKQLRVSLPNPNASALEPVVDVYVRIGEKRIEKAFVISYKEEKLTKRASVVLYGARSLINKIQPESLHPEQIKTDSGEKSLQLDLPEGVQELTEKRKLKPDR